MRWKHSNRIHQWAMKMIRTYSELIKLPTYEGRFEYLALHGKTTDMTFGGHRWINQRFYESAEWKKARDQVILRDSGSDYIYDLGCPDRPIIGKCVIHHMIPLTVEAIENMDDTVLNPEYLICCSLDTHNHIHYGNINTITTVPKERTLNDTIPWR